MNPQGFKMLLFKRNIFFLYLMGGKNILDHNCLSVTVVYERRTLKSEATFDNGNITFKNDVKCFLFHLKAYLILKIFKFLF